ncbi:MAG: OmpA family protein [Gammaproteobacteria bacterium]|nr:OmpA family protein [Gammaproteobacteria bacterium]
MIKYIVFGFVCLCLVNVVAHADVSAARPDRSSEPAGLGLGALLGGLIAGPPGAILGAAGGRWLGSRAAHRNGQIAELEQGLAQRNGELAALQAEFHELEKLHGRELQRVNADGSGSALERISRGVSLSVYFRTASAELDPEFTTRIERLAALLQALPRVRLHLDAHADRRGTPAYNRALSERRAQAVRRILTGAGLPAERIQSHAHGETRALAAEGDAEGYVFDRRVSIDLSVDPEA